MKMQKNIINIKMLKCKSGATLVVIIVTILIMAVIGAAIYSLTYTAFLNQIIAQRDAKAFYIAESCVRVAASEYKAAQATAKNSTLVSLHNQLLNMPDNQGKCTVYIYPYWFYARDGIPANTNQLTLYIPGEAPVTFLANGRLRIKDDNRTPAWTGRKYVTFSNNASGGAFNGANGGTEVTFNISTPYFTNAIIAGDEFYIGYVYSSPQNQYLNEGDSLILNIDAADTDFLTAKIFPPEKGSIFLEGADQYYYEDRIIDEDNRTVTLTNIRPIPAATYEPTWEFPSYLYGDRYIYIGKSIGLSSKSTYGD
jgi:type II secretory pathway pseudopilin PulG